MFCTTVSKLVGITNITCSSCAWIWFLYSLWFIFNHPITYCLAKRQKKTHCVDFRPEIKHFFRSKMSEIIRFCISVRYVDLLVVICFVRERFFFWGGYLATDLILYWTCHLVGSIEMNKVMNKSWG